MEWLDVPGWTRAGDMWGNALWKKVDDTLVLALGQCEDGLTAPFDMNEATTLFVFRGPIPSDWSPENEYVEAPFFPDEDTDEGEFKRLVYPNLIHALDAAGNIVIDHGINKVLAKADVA